MARALDGYRPRDVYLTVPRHVLSSEAPSYARALCNLQRAEAEAIATWQQCDPEAELVCWARVIEARARLSLFLREARETAS